MHNESKLEEFKKLVLQLGRADLKDVDLYTYITNALLDFMEQNESS